MSHRSSPGPTVERMALSVPMGDPNAQMTLHALIYQGWIVYQMHELRTDHDELAERGEAKYLADRAVLALCACYDVPPLVECTRTDENGDPHYGPTAFGLAAGLTGLAPGEAPTVVEADVIAPPPRATRFDPRTHKN